MIKPIETETVSLHFETVRFEAKPYGKLQDSKSSNQ
jgi:hypothetical protein